MSTRNIIIITGDEEHCIWCNNLYVLLRKVTADDTLYKDLYLAKSKEEVIQAFANTAVRVQIFVRTSSSADE